MGKIRDDGEDPLPALITQFYFRDESPPFPDELALDVMEVNPQHVQVWKLRQWNHCD